MFQDQACEIAGIDATEEVVASGYGRVCSRVVDKAGGVVEAGRFSGGLPEAAHALWGVQEPPWGAHRTEGIRAGDRGCPRL